MKIRADELILYRDIDDDILRTMAHIANTCTDSGIDHAAAVSAVYHCMNELVGMAGMYGFCGNLWQEYLTWLLTTNENAFSIACEKTGAASGSLHDLALHDLQIFHEAYHMDWYEVENALDTHFVDLIISFTDSTGRAKAYSHTLQERIHLLNCLLAKAQDVQEMYTYLTEFYLDFGVGKYGLHRAFKLAGRPGETRILPITQTEKVVLSDLVGYELQKKKLIENTQAFVDGKPANNVLLYGDRGTGKSTSIKAILNAYYPHGLRMIEIYKHQFQEIPEVLAQIKNRNYRFILYMDDLSFEEFETDYKYLKAVIEGGLETKPENTLIYATSNRRHLIRETWGERKQNSDDVHGGDSMQEKLSLAARFGETIYYGAPTQKEYLKIVQVLAQRSAICLQTEELQRQAVEWEMKHGGLSGRTAQQFMNHLSGQTAGANEEISG